MFYLIQEKREVISFDYTMQDQVLNRQESISDLGLIVDENLNWKEHIKCITNKANQRLGLVKRTLGHNMKSEIKLQSYKSLVQLILEYCTPGLTVIGKRLTK